MDKTVVINNVDFEKIEKLVDEFESKYSFDTNHFVDYLYYDVKEEVLGKQPKKYTIILSDDKERYRVILTDDETTYKESYAKHFKEYMEE